ncbi:AMP-binding protein [Maribacter aestuarii]|uniref:AMP-binding protein n=1 Tax=Maribacter aestuarii TaxID=1130723 RepID=UPI0025A5077D|nr:AMP-binding protein [Maribacter aestuarii]
MLKHADIHPQFSLNGHSFQKKTLTDFASDFIKEGESFEKEIGQFIMNWLSENDTIQVNTSGSTGKPKTILLRKEHMFNSARATGNFFHLEPGNSALHCLPTEFIAGKMMLVRAMVLGLEMDCIAPSSSPLINSNKHYDFAAMVPLQLENSTHEIDSIEQIIVGGAPVSNRLRQMLQGKETKVFETYGMTETITHIAARLVNPKNEQNREMESRPFQTLPNVFIKTDARDCLVIEAPNISDSVVITNDIVNLVSNTEFEWLGRYDSVINSGGVKLVPEQIEKKLELIVERPFFVAGLPDSSLGQKLVLVIEGDIDKMQLMDIIKNCDELNKFQVPKEIYSVTQFSRTSNGKLNRKETLARIKAA